MVEVDENKYTRKKSSLWLHLAIRLSQRDKIYGDFMVYVKYQWLFSNNFIWEKKKEREKKVVNVNQVTDCI